MNSTLQIIKILKYNENLLKIEIARDNLERSYVVIIFYLYQYIYNFEHDNLSNSNGQRPTPSRENSENINKYQKDSENNDVTF